MTAYTPNLPALITALPGDHTRAAQTEFTRERQVQFLENLSLTGSVRSAAAAAGVSHQTAYRARRGTGGFRLAWDAALVTARANAEATLASRAIDGMEEEIRYHGEVVGTRTRYSDRLLLAHLARLDRLVESPSANAFADDFDAALARFGRGEDAVPKPVPEEGEIFSSGPCNTRSKSNSDSALAEPADEDIWDAADDYEDDYEDEDEDEDEDDDGIDWEDEDACNAELDRIRAAMEADRPADAPRLDADDPHGLIATAQHEAFVRKVPRWWLVVPSAPYPDKRDWRYADEEDLVEEETAEHAAPERDDAPGEDEPEDDEADGDLDDDEEATEEDPVSPAGMEVEVLPQPTPRPPLNRIVKPWPRQPWNGLPVNDGRLQPFHGRGY